MEDLKLNTVEKFLLLAHRPERGGFSIQDIQLNHGIAGATLLELSLMDMIGIEKDRLIVKTSQKTGNGTLSKFLSIVSGSAKKRKIGYWINKLAGKSRKYKWEILSGMASKHLIRIENKSFLSLIPYKKSYLQNANMRHNIIQSLNKSVYQNEISSEDMALFGLIEACKMHKIFTHDRAELQKIRKKLKLLIKESPISSTVDKTIKQVQAALIAAIISATVITATTTSSS